MDLIEINGVRLELVRIAGDDRPPVVFLHEGLGSVGMWRGWPDAVCKATGRAGVVWSRRGYGLSDPVPDVRGTGRLKPDYMHHQAWVVLPALLQRLGIRQPVLLGHSDGGSIALLYASRYPVAACIVMAPHVMVEEISIQSIAQAREAFEAGGLRARLARHHADVDCAFWQWNDAWLDPAFRAFDIRGECRAISAPVLAIQGENDAYGTMRQIEEIAPTRGPIQLEKLAACGHSPQRDQPGRVTQLVQAFLAQPGR